MICACKNQKYKLYFCTKTRFLKKHNINFNTNQNKQYLIFNKIVIMFECYFITLSIDFKTNHDNIPFFFLFQHTKHDVGYTFTKYNKMDASYIFSSNNLINQSINHYNISISTHM